VKLMINISFLITFVFVFLAEVNASILPSGLFITVIDAENSERINDATVSIKDKGSKNPRGTGHLRASRDGVYPFPGIIDGVYEVQVTKEGYDDSKAFITIRPGQQATQTVRLKRKSPQKGPQSKCWPTGIIPAFKGKRNDTCCNKNDILVKPKVGRWRCQAKK